MSYQAGSWEKQQVVEYKIAWHGNEFFPRIGFVVTNFQLSVEKVVKVYNRSADIDNSIYLIAGSIPSPYRSEPKHYTVRKKLCDRGRGSDGANSHQTKRIHTSKSPHLVRLAHLAQIDPVAFRIPEEC